MITWIGAVNEVADLIFSVLVIWTIFRNEKMYQLSTKVFFLAYAGYLVGRGFITLSEPVTVTETIRCILNVAILVPLTVCTMRVLNLGDPFRLGLLVEDLKKKLKEKEQLEIKMTQEDFNWKEQAELRERVALLDRTVSKLESRLENLLKQNRHI